MPFNIMVSHEVLTDFDDYDYDNYDWDYHDYDVCCSNGKITDASDDDASDAPSYDWDDDKLPF